MVLHLILCILFCIRIFAGNHDGGHRSFEGQCPGQCTARGRSGRRCVALQLQAAKEIGFSVLKKFGNCVSRVKQMEGFHSKAVILIEYRVL